MNTKVDKLIFFGALLFFLIRIISISWIPIFNDEAIYVRWGEALLAKFGEFSTPVSLDGKQMGTPLVFGLTQFLPFDPLLSARLPVVIFSLGSYFSLIYISGKLFPKRNVILLIIFSVFCPYLLIFDRLALPDGLITAFYTLAVALTIRLRDNLSYKNGIFLGITIGLGWWFKSTILLAAVPVCILLVCDFLKKPKERVKLIRTGIIIVFAFITTVLPIIINPAYAKFVSFASSRFISFSDLWRLPLRQWITNLYAIFLYIFFYGGPVVFFLFLLGIRKLRRNKILSICLLFFIVPVLFESFFLQNINGRYPSFLIPIYLLLSLAGTDAIKNKILKAIVVLSVVLEGGILILSPLSFYKLWRFIPQIKGDFGQYVTGWTSGYGVKEAANLLIAKSKGENIVVFVRYDSGNPEDGVGVYLYKNKIPFVPLNYLPSISQQMKAENIKASYYFVSRGNQEAGIGPFLRLVTRYNKPLDPEFVGVYKINTD